MKNFKKLISSKLRVLHKSDNFLIVNKHPDLVLNTNPPDQRSRYKLSSSPPC